MRSPRDWVLALVIVWIGCAVGYILYPALDLMSR